VDANMWLNGSTDAVGEIIKHVNSVCFNSII